MNRGLVPFSVFHTFIMSSQTLGLISCFMLHTEEGFYDIEVTPSWAAARGRCSLTAWNQTPGDGSARPPHNEDEGQARETPAAWNKKRHRCQVGNFNKLKGSYTHFQLCLEYYVNKLWIKYKRDDRERPKDDSLRVYSVLLSFVLTLYKANMNTEM